MDWNGQPAYWRGLACHQTPDDLWIFAETVWSIHPDLVLEVGRGEGGTSQFLAALRGLPVDSIEKGDPVIPIVPQSFVILDGDVYSREATLLDLQTYGPYAQWLVVCHTVRGDWGAGPALAEWWPHHPEWVSMPVRHETRHTWLTRQ